MKTSAWKVYIERLDDEIEELIEEEADGLTEDVEDELHVLFENRKHAIECLMEHERDMAHVPGVPGVPR